MKGLEISLILLAPVLLLCAWTPAGQNMKTVWGEALTADHVHAEYPRPQMVRGDWQSLNGLWQYAIVPQDAPQPEAYDGEILVPFCPESSLSGVGGTVGAQNALWYRTEVSVPSSWRRSRTLLHFEAVDWSAEVFLNGKRICTHTDGLYTAPSDEALRYDLEMTKKLGFNMIRKHIKVEPARWYWYCDRMGILVWQDMPSTDDSRTGKWATDDFGTGRDSQLSEWEKENYYKEWSEIISARKGFNCIVVWVPFNEAWGQFDTERVVAFTRGQDPTRLVNAASGGNHYEGCGDILDSHHYPNPRQNLWSPAAANVVGEYGGIGLALQGHLWQEEKNWGYIQYKTPREVTDTYVRYARQLQDLSGRGCSGGVYTQTTDVEGEVNGLLTYDRKVVKVDVDRVSAVNREIISSFK